MLTIRQLLVQVAKDNHHAEVDTQYTAQEAKHGNLCVAI